MAATESDQIESVAQELAGMDHFSMATLDHILGKRFSGGYTAETKRRILARSAEIRNPKDP